MKMKFSNKEFHPEGNIKKEMKEIAKIHDESVYVYSIVTNTCSPFLSIVCC